MKQLKFYEEKLKPKMNNTRKGDEGMEIKIDLRKVAKGDDKMNIEERIVKEKISTGEDLVLCVDNIVFEQDLKCKNISCKSLKKSFKVKGNIDAENINALNISYFASCVSQETFKCVSVKGRRDKSIHVCLDNEIEFCKDKDCVAKGDE